MAIAIPTNKIINITNERLVLFTIVMSIISFITLPIASTEINKDTNKDCKTSISLIIFLGVLFTINTIILILMLSDDSWCL